MFPFISFIILSFSQKPFYFGHVLVHDGFKLVSLTLHYEISVLNIQPCAHLVDGFSLLKMKVHIPNFECFCELFYCFLHASFYVPIIEHIILRKPAYEY